MARELDLDLERFRDDFASPPVTTKIEEDVRGGIRSGVNGTPTFFINGTRHDDSYDFETLLAAVERAAGKQPARSHTGKGK